MKVVIFGSGWVVTNRHIPALIKNKGIKISGIINPNLEQALNLASELKDCMAAKTIEELSESFDIAVIGTPPHVHLENIKSCLDKKIKYILVEKPLALNSAEARILIERAKLEDSYIFTLHNFLYLESFLKTKEAIKSFGKIKSISCRQWSGKERHLPNWINQPESSIFFDEAPHLYYLCRSLVGDMSLLNKQTFEDGMLLQYQAKDTYLTIDARDNLAISAWQLEIFCESGYAKIDLWRDMFFVLPQESSRSYFAYRSGLELIKQELIGLLKIVLNRTTKGRMLFGANLMFDNILHVIANGDKRALDSLQVKQDGLYVVHKIEEALVSK